MTDTQALPGLEPVTADEIKRHLLIKYDGDTYRNTPNTIAIEEARVSTGSARRSIDVFAVHQFASKDFQRIAFEIKVSRGDFLRELREPLKRRDALMHSNQFYFVTPPELVDPEEVPPECGLIEYHREDPHLDTRKPYDRLFDHFVDVVPAPYRDTLPPTWGLFVSVLRKERERCFELASRRHEERDRVMALLAQRVLGVLDRAMLGRSSGKDELLDELGKLAWDYRRLTGSNSSPLIGGRDDRLSRILKDFEDTDSASES